MENVKYPQRKSPRIPHFDYRSPGYYFVTICTHEKKHLFGEPGIPSLLGMIAEEALSQIEPHFPGVRLDKSVVMPNHVHMIIILEQGDRDLSAVIGSYKSYVSKRAHEAMPNTKIWQVSFHDHVIRDRAGYEKIWMYIDTNPLRWEDDCFYG